MKADHRGVLTRCSSCGKTNRLPYAHLDRAIRCGNCHTMLPPPGGACRGAGRRVVRRPAAAGACSGCRGLLGALVWSLSNDGAGGRNGRAQHGRPRAGGQGRHRSRARAWPTLSHPFDSHPRAVSQRSRDLASRRREAGVRDRSARRAKLNDGKESRMRNSVRAAHVCSCESVCVRVVVIARTHSL